MSKRGLTKEALDAMSIAGCQMPGCDHTDHDGTIFFHGRCHIGGRIEVSYTYESGVIEVACVECGSKIGTVRVAKE